jgi:hypothetical protein
MSILSEAIQEAFYDTWIYDSFQEEIIERFTHQWGGLDAETFHQVLAKGQGKDRVFAIFALANLAPTDVVTLLSPFLESERREDRWASAISLGRLRDPRVFPLLQDLLLSSIEDYYKVVTMRGDTYAWYHQQRHSIALILGAWGNPQATPVLRHALQTVWQLEQQPGPFDGSWRGHLEEMHYLQDSLAYALGRLEAWGVLVHLGLPPSHLSLAMQHMILGYLRIKLIGIPGLLGFYKFDDEPLNPEIPVVDKRQFKTVLAQRFGLFEEEQDRFLLQVAHDFRKRHEEVIKK